MTGGEILRVIAEALAAASLPHALIGGHAVNVYLEPRFTADIDITVRADADALDLLRGALQAAGYRVSTEYGVDLPSGPDFVRFRRGPTDPPIELQAAKTRFQEEVIARASPSGPTLPAVATAEDLIVLKLIANRPKDRIDLLGLVELPGLDWGYIEGWAREWDVLDRLAQLRK